ncbi:hypothetical protein EUX98_g5040 [Antrodiella citrinella]|uniref:Uncharacterized protein n=1 Tax=Antrodiella citrinella TaxID=2447956 RepID=A0A4S4N0H1_9APHY|nr:hypothetical protein EUX98_g5040 [Antrodiella citrinella]
MQPRISEEDPSDLTRMSLDELTMSRTPESCRDDDLTDDATTNLSHMEVVTARKVKLTHRSRAQNDSISSIELRDLPALHDEDDNKTPIPPSRMLRAGTQPAALLVRAISKSKLNKALPPLPARDSIASAPASASGRRAMSPDIQSIMASTPKPRRKSASALSRSESRSQSSTPRRSDMKRRVSEGQTGPFTVTIDSFDLDDLSRQRKANKASDLPYVRRHEEEILDDNASFVSDYGEYISGSMMEGQSLERDAEMKLERQLEGDGSDSDSSIDVQTPLPNLMLRDGLLSPRSKLLPQSFQPPVPQPSMDRMSLASTSASVMTKSGLFKDARDTQKRRVRHRDGRLLKGGIGLTTGLGWSDSEDEDAPSPLTRRLSSLILSKKSSAASLRSSTLSRSCWFAIEYQQRIDHALYSVLWKFYTDEQRYGLFVSSTQ